MTGTNWNAVISVKHTHGVTFKEGTLIMLGHFKSSGLELGSEVEVPNSAKVLATMNVLGDIWNPVFGIVT